MSNRKTEVTSTTQYVPFTTIRNVLNITRLQRVRLQRVRGRSVVIKQKKSAVSGEINECKKKRKQLNEKQIFRFQEILPKRIFSFCK